MRKELFPEGFFFIVLNYSINFQNQEYKKDSNREWLHLFIHHSTNFPDFPCTNYEISEHFKLDTKKVL